MKQILSLITMAVIGLSMQAGIYIVGNAPFGDWNPSNGLEMNDNGDGTYTAVVTLTGTVWFVFADGLTQNETEWDLFNSEYRYGPSIGSDQTVNANEYTSTQKQGNGNGAYTFVAGAEPEEYSFTFDLDNMAFIIEGSFIRPPEYYYTVAGTPATVFGTEWDVTNIENDMTLNEEGKWQLDKYECWIENDVSFKVVLNHDWGHSWPDESFNFVIEEPGYYDVHITFDSATRDITAEAVPGYLPPPPPLEGVYILGEVNGNEWAPNLGVVMATMDSISFTALVEATGEIIDEDDGKAYSYFAFTGRLAEEEYDWAAIRSYRFGPSEGECYVNEEMLGTDLMLSRYSVYTFRVASNKKYSMTINLDEMTLNITEVSDSVDELAAGKTVSDVRYFNVMGQEMNQANGVTIVVTRYTDGSTTATKVIK